MDGLPNQIYTCSRLGEFKPISQSEQLVRVMRLQKNEIGGNLHPMGGVLMMEKGNLIFVKLNNAE